MVSKFKYNLVRINSITNTSKFKLIIMMCIIGSFLASFNIIEDESFEIAIVRFIHSDIYTIILMSLLLITSFYTITTFNKDLTMFLRYKNKKEYLTKLFELVTIMNLIVYICYTLVGLTIVVLKYYGNITLSSHYIYGVPFIIYNIYVYIKFFIIINLLCLISSIIYKNYGKIYGISFIIFIFFCYRELSIINIDIISEFKEFPILFNYYLYPLEYSSFSLEICAFTLQSIILLLVYESIKFLTIKIKKISLEE